MSRNLRLLVAQVKAQNRFFWRVPVGAFFTLILPIIMLNLFVALFGNDLDFDGPTDVKRLWHVPVSGTHPPDKWQPGQFIVDHHDIITHTRHKRGEYDVLLGYESDGKLVPTTAADGVEVVDDRVQVATYTLTR